MLGIVGAIVMFMGARQIFRRTHDRWADFFSYTMFLGFLVAPVFAVASIGTQITKRSRGWTARAKC